MRSIASVGQIRGRQYVLCILLSAILGALSAPMAVAGCSGARLFPTMVQRGYNKRLSAGTIMAGACLDPIIPPSVLAVVVASIANVSPAAMLIAGILPGLLMMSMFLVYVLARVWLTPSLAPDSLADIQDRNREGSKTVAVLSMLPCAFVFFMVMGLIMFGVATPTEAAATGVFGAIAVSLYYGGLSRQMIWEAAQSAATISCLLLVIMCSAVMFSQLMTFTGAANGLGELVAGMALAPSIMLLVMLALPFVLFMFLDQVAIMLILIPIYQPLLKLYGFGEIWFWTLFLVITVSGGLTPPFRIYPVRHEECRSPDIDDRALQCGLAIRLDHRRRRGAHGTVSADHHLPAQPDWALVIASTLQRNATGRAP